MDERIPELIQPMLENYVQELNGQFPDLLHSFYIIGSIALGEFNPHFSDIDFLTILNRPMTAVEIHELQAIYKKLEKGFPQWKMSGCYIQMCDLGITEDIAPHPHYHDGKLHEAARFELNPVTWWELKHFGIAIGGVEPQDLSFTVDWNNLIFWVRKNMNSYWAGWANRPVRIMLLCSDWGIQWTVTGILRQFYTLKENKITTKVKAAQYALDCLPERWHSLIQDAINIRERKKKSAYGFKINRAVEAVRFLKFMIQTCNTTTL